MPKGTTKKKEVLQKDHYLLTNLVHNNKLQRKESQLLVQKLLSSQKQSFPFKLSQKTDKGPCQPKWLLVLLTLEQTAIKTMAYH